MRKHIMTEWNV